MIAASFLDPVTDDFPFALGYRVGRVRLIFSLPSELQRLRLDATDPSPHLAYLELFTPFTPRPDRYSGLYSVSKSYSDGARKTLVVPLTRIFRSCHLLPKCGRQIDHTWTSETVLDQCEHWTLNAFSDHHMYLSVE